jgi:hypothetical protein
MNKKIPIHPAEVFSWSGDKCGLTQTGVVEISRLKQPIVLEVTPDKDKGDLLRVKFADRTIKFEQTGTKIAARALDVHGNPIAIREWYFKSAPETYNGVWKLIIRDSNALDSRTARNVKEEPSCSETEIYL